MSKIFCADWRNIFLLWQVRLNSEAPEITATDIDVRSKALRDEKCKGKFKLGNIPLVGSRVYHTLQDSPRNGFNNNANKKNFNNQ